MSTDASFVSVVKPCEQALEDMTEAYELRCDQLEQSWDALQRIRELDEDNFKSAYHYQVAVRSIANEILA